MRLPLKFLWSNGRTVLYALCSNCGWEQCFQVLLCSFYRLFAICFIDPKYYMACEQRRCLVQYTLRIRKAIKILTFLTACVSLSTNIGLIFIEQRYQIFSPVTGNCRWAFFSTASASKSLRLLRLANPDLREARKISRLTSWCTCTAFAELEKPTFQRGDHRLHQPTGHLSRLLLKLAYQYLF